MLSQYIKGYAVLLAWLLLSAHPVSAQLNVFACKPEWAALAQAIGGGKLKIYTATTPRQDPHHIQARPSLIAKARRADLLACTGAELEIGWLPLLLRKSGNPKIQIGQLGYFMAADHVTLLEKPAVLDRSQGDMHAAGNPHIHLDPDLILQVAVSLTDVLVKIDGVHQTFYRQNLENFTQAWRKAMTQWREKAQMLEGKKLVVHHNSWVYLEQWLGMQRIATLEPKPGIPPTSSHLSRLVSTLKHTPADIIIYAGYQDNRAAKWLSKKTGIPNIALDSSVAKDETLLQWFDRLLDQLLAVLA